MLTYTITDIQYVATDTMRIILRPDSAPLTFIAGQYVQVAFVTKSVPYEFHPFSLVSAPDDKQVHLLIKILGDYTATLNSLRIGDKAHVKGPYGTFSYGSIHEKHQVWIATGIAIAPFLSMAQTLKMSGKDVQLYHFIRSRDEASEAARLKQLQRNLSDAVLNVHVRIGPCTSDALTQIFAKHAGAGVLVCGGKELRRRAQQTANMLRHEGTLLFDDFVAEPIASEAYSS